MCKKRKSRYAPRTTRFVLGLGVLVMTRCAPSGHGTSQDEGPKEAVLADRSQNDNGLVARVNGMPITKKMVATRMRSTKRGKKKVLKELIDEHLLLRYAEKLRLQESSGFRTRVRTLLVRNFLKRDIEAKVAPVSSGGQSAERQLHAEQKRALVLAAQELARRFSIERNTDNLAVLGQIEVQRKNQR